VSGSQDAKQRRSGFCRWVNADADGRLDMITHGGEVGGVWLVCLRAIHRLDARRRRCISDFDPVKAVANNDSKTEKKPRFKRTRKPTRRQMPKLKRNLIPRPGLPLVKTRFLSPRNGRGEAAI